MNSNIAMGIQPIQIPDQGASYQRALTMAALLGQHDLQGLQLQEGQRTLKQNQLMDEAAQGSSSMDDYLSRLSRINPGAAAKLKNEMAGTQKTQGEVFEQQSKLAQGLTAGFMSVPDEQKPQAYPQFVAEWKRQNLPTANPIPDQFSPEMIPHLTMIANRGLTSEQSATRADYAGSAPTAGQPTTMAAHLAQPIAAAPLGAGSQAYIDRFTPEETTIGGANPDIPPSVNQSAAQERAAWDAPAKTTAPTETVTAKPPMETPDGLRAEAMRLEGLMPRTKVNMDQAKEKRAEAVALDGRLNDQTRLEAENLTPSSVPGVVFNKKNGQFTQNGKPITAEKMQEIQLAQHKAMATNVHVGMNATDASKAELLNQGISDMAEFKGMLISPDGKINRGIITGMNIPGMAGVPYTDSRIAYSLISNAVEAKLRAESGAAVPKEEVTRMAARFIPSPLDSDETILSKVRRMEAFLRGSFGRIKGAGEPSVKAAPNEPIEGKPLAAPKTIKWEDLQ